MATVKFRPGIRKFFRPAYLGDMLRSILLLPLLLLSYTSIAQRYGQHWQFGLQVGLDFSECSPKVFRTGSNTGFEGCATVSNEEGELLFYTNSETVWNSLHEEMPDGDLQPGGASLSQVLIQNVPLSSSLYYIFTTTIQASDAGQFRYHVVSMDEDNGLGDVILSDQVLFTGTTTEHVAATRHANGIDVWVMARAYPSAQFMAYLLTPAGIVAPPVISMAGPDLIGGNSNMNTRGELKFSVDGTRMAIACNGIGGNDATNLLALYRFNNSTGVVSDAIELPTGRGDFGLSFSPDGTRLYEATWKAFSFGVNDVNSLYQFDLTSDDPATIIASRTTIHDLPSGDLFGALKLGPDGRIYVAVQNGSYLGVITDPNALGLECTYVHEGLHLEGATCNYGLNNYIEYVDCDALHVSVPDRSAHTEHFSIVPNPTSGPLTLVGLAADRLHAVRILDAAGRIIMQRTVFGNAPWDLSALAPGGYSVYACSNDGTDCSHQPLFITR